MESDSSLSDAGKLVLRLTTAGLLLFHGISKILHGISGISHGVVAHHLPAFIAYGVYIGEVVAPLFLILGLWTRIAALVVMFDLFVAVALVAYRNFFVLSRSGGWAVEAEAFYFLTALAIFLLGAGRLAVSRDKSFWG